MNTSLSLEHIIRKSSLTENAPLLILLHGYGSDENDLFSFANELPEGVSLNVNVPAIHRDQIKGAVVTRQGKSRVIETFDKRVNPRNETYYWLAGEMKFDEVEKGTDCEMVEEGYISVTPIHFDLTHFQALETLRDWKINF